MRIGLTYRGYDHDIVIRPTYAATASATSRVASTPAMEHHVQQPADKQIIDRPNIQDHRSTPLDTYLSLGNYQYYQAQNVNFAQELLARHLLGQAADTPTRNTRSDHTQIRDGGQDRIAMDQVLDATALSRDNIADFFDHAALNYRQDTRTAVGAEGVVGVGESTRTDTTLAVDRMDRTRDTEVGEASRLSADYNDVYAHRKLEDGNTMPRPHGKAVVDLNSDQNLNRHESSWDRKPVVDYEYFQSATEFNMHRPLPKATHDLEMGGLYPAIDRASQGIMVAQKLQEGNRLARERLEAGIPATFFEARQPQKPGYGHPASGQHVLQPGSFHAIGENEAEVAEGQGVPNIHLFQTLPLPVIMGAPETKPMEPDTAIKISPTAPHARFEYETIFFDRAHQPPMEDMPRPGIPPVDVKRSVWMVKPIRLATTEDIRNEDTITNTMRTSAHLDTSSGVSAAAGASATRSTSAEFQEGDAVVTNEATTGHTTPLNPVLIGMDEHYERSREAAPITVETMPRTNLANLGPLHVDRTQTRIPYLAGIQRGAMQGPAEIAREYQHPNMASDISVSKVELDNPFDYRSHYQVSVERENVRRTPDLRRLTDHEEKAHNVEKDWDYQKIQKITENQLYGRDKPTITEIVTRTERQEIDKFSIEHEYLEGRHTSPIEKAPPKDIMPENLKSLSVENIVWGWDRNKSQSS